MRGKDNYMTVSVDDFRITPAYAGKSGSACLRCSDAEDHPRLCGEKQNSPRIEYKSVGSPPPMRGKAHGTEKIDTDLGITPAYAGKSTKPTSNMYAIQDHPRLCGEKP